MDIRRIGGAEELGTLYLDLGPCESRYKKQPKLQSSKYKALSTKSQPPTYAP
jgi:hypothetical protein